MDLNQLRTELTRDEGLRLSAYRDSVGLWTIGVGHLLGNTVRMTDITRGEAMALLEYDIKVAIETADRWLPAWRFATERRKRAIINMCFNLGSRIAQFARFRNAVASGDWLRAGKEMENSDWWAQVGARAVRLRAMIEVG